MIMRCGFSVAGPVVGGKIGMRIATGRPLAQHKTICLKIAVVGEISQKLSLARKHRIRIGVF